MTFLAVRKHKYLRKAVIMDENSHPSPPRLCIRLAVCIRHHSDVLLRYLGSLNNFPLHLRCDSVVQMCTIRSNLPKNSTVNFMPGANSLFINLF